MHESLPNAIDYIEMPSRDLAGTKRFFAALFGWSFVDYGPDYASFDDYWASFSTGPTRIAQRLTALPAQLRAEIERNVRAGYLAGLPDGPRSFAIIVRVVRGIVPQ